MKVISWCVVSIYQWFRWNKPFTKRLFTSLSVCMHKGFDLQWNRVATQKATDAVIYRLTPLRLLSWQLIIHNHRFVWAMEWACLSVSVCLSVCVSASSFSYVPLFDSHVHSRTFIPNNHCHHHHCCYWSYFIFLFFWKRRETALLSGRCWRGGRRREGGREGGWLETREREKEIVRVVDE